MPRPIEPRYVLLISQDTIGTRMAGSAIRYFQIAKALARDFNVMLASPDETALDLSDDRFQMIQYRRADWDSIKEAVHTANVIILPSDIASDLPQLASSPVPLVVDGYDPMLAEWLQMAHGLSPDEKQARWLPRMRDLSQQYLLGDFFICASERQRDWWLGALAGYGRVNPWTFADDSSFRHLVDVVPYGLPEKPPQYTRTVIRNIWKNIPESSRVILWGGGLWPWLDPLTAVRAIAKIITVRNDVCLIFPGTHHPNPWMDGMPNQTDAARELAHELGLLDIAIFFHDWIPYEDWQNVLLESDLALTLHGAETLETRLAFRSRVLDYIWAGLPIVATRGDATSELIAENQLGVLVPSHDVDTVAQAILNLLSTPRSDYSLRFDQVRSSLTWERAVRPLVEFCRSPRRAPDKQALGFNLGNPFYMQKIADLQNKLQAFERRRVVRLLNTMVDTKTKLLGQ